MLRVEDIRLRLDGYNFTDGKSEYGKWMTLEELVEYTQNLYADLSYYEEKAEDLENEIEDLKEKIEELEEDMENNYERIPLSRQYGVNDNDFI